MPNLAKVTNSNSRTHLILQLAKQASARQDDEWEVRLKEVNMNSTSTSQFLVDTHSGNNQSSSRVTEDSVVEDDLSLSDPYCTDNSMGDPDYSDDTIHPQLQVTKRHY
nr:unnamed protein product [Callosobruchus analis]